MRNFVEWQFSGSACLISGQSATGGVAVEEEGELLTFIHWGEKKFWQSKLAKGGDCYHLASPPFIHPFCWSSQVTIITFFWSQQQFAIHARYVLRFSICIAELVLKCVTGYVVLCIYGVAPGYSLSASTHNRTKQQPRVHSGLTSHLGAALCSAYCSAAAWCWCLSPATGTWSTPRSGSTGAVRETASDARWSTCWRRSS